MLVLQQKRQCFGVRTGQRLKRPVLQICVDLPAPVDAASQALINLCFLHIPSLHNRYHLIISSCLTLLSFFQNTYNPSLHVLSASYFPRITIPSYSIRVLLTQLYQHHAEYLSPYNGPFSFEVIRVGHQKHPIVPIVHSTSGLPTPAVTLPGNVRRTRCMRPLTHVLSRILRRHRRSPFGTVASFTKIPPLASELPKILRGASAFIIFSLYILYYANEW